MGPTAGEIEQQIAGTRDDMESKIVELRERSQRTIRQTRRVVVLALGAGAAIGLAVGTAVVLRRLTRPPTLSERITRVLPWWRSLGWVRERFELGLRRSVPPMRLYVGERQLGEKPAGTRWEWLAVRSAQAMGTALAGAIVARATQSLTKRDRSA